MATPTPKHSAAGKARKTKFQLKLPHRRMKVAMTDTKNVLANLFGLLGLLLLLIFVLLGLLCLIITLLLLRAAVTLGLCRPPWRSLRRLEVDTSVCRPIWIFTGRVTENGQRDVVSLAIMTTCWGRCSSSLKIFTWSYFHSATVLRHLRRRRFVPPVLLPVNREVKSTFIYFKRIKANFFASFKYVRY